MKILVRRLPNCVSRCDRLDEIIANGVAEKWGCYFFKTELPDGISAMFDKTAAEAFVNKININSCCPKSWSLEEVCAAGKDFMILVADLLKQQKLPKGQVILFVDETEIPSCSVRFVTTRTDEPNYLMSDIESYNEPVAVINY